MAKLLFDKIGLRATSKYAAKVYAVMQLNPKQTNWMSTVATSSYKVSDYLL